MTQGSCPDQTHSESFEVSTTWTSDSIESALQYIANGDADGFVRDAIHRAQDWMNA